MPPRKSQPTERGDSSEIQRAIANTQARYREELDERGYGDDGERKPAQQVDMFFQGTETEAEPTKDLPSTVTEPRAMPGEIAKAEAQLQLSWRNHERLIGTGIDPANIRVKTSERRLLDHLYTYERLANPEYYAQMQREGRRPQ